MMLLEKIKEDELECVVRAVGGYPGGASVSELIADLESSGWSKERVRRNVRHSFQRGHIQMGEHMKVFTQ